MPGVAGRKGRGRGAGFGGRGGRAPTQQTGDSVAATILKPYEARKELGPIRRFFVYALLVFIAMIYGLFSAVLPPQLLTMTILPILIFAAIIFWLLPDVGGIAYDGLQRAMFCFVAFSIAWPNYVAFNLPGLPQITPQRAAMFTMAGIFLMNFSSSQQMRDAVKDVVSIVPTYMKIFWGLFIAMAFSIVFSEEKGESINRFFNNMIYWNLILFISALLATRKDFVHTIYKILLYSTCIVLVFTLYEARIERVPWLNYLPPFLQIDEQLLATVSSPQYRAGTDIYRVRGPFAAALYFSEYLTMAFPFFVHFVFTEPKSWRRLLLAAATVGLMVIMYLTNARSAMVGIVVVIALYPFYWALQFRIKRQNSLFATASLAAYPGVLGLLALIIMFWPRARVAVLGGGATASSSNARDIQWELAIPKVMAQPFGYGVGDGNNHLGYTNPGGVGSVDSYFITIMLDAGFLALPLFVACFLIPAFLAFRKFPGAQTDEERLWAPLSIALINFTLVKSVLSSEYTQTLAFIFVGCIIGLVWQQQRRTVPGATPVPLGPVVAAVPRKVVPASGAPMPLPGRG
jgi:hypothetical protein